MHIDFPAAMAYPFRPKNRANCVLYPGLVQYLLYLTVYSLTPGVKISSEPFFIDAENYKQLMLFNFYLSIPSFFIVSAFSTGFNWTLLHRFKTEGLEAVAPNWAGSVIRFWKEGMKVNLFFIFFLLPSFVQASLPILLTDTRIKQVIDVETLLPPWIPLLTLAFYLLGWPFASAAIWQSSDQRTLGSLLNLKAAVKVGRTYYRQMLKGTLLFIALTLLYLIGFYIAILLTCYAGSLTFPFLIAALTTTANHITAQIFLSEPSEKAMAIQPLNG